VFRNERGAFLYSHLYNSRQAAPAYVSRQWYLDDALALPWVREIKIKRTDALNVQSVRGLIYSDNRQSHGGMESFDYTIVLANGMSVEYERFVTIKELMHCYFPPVDGHVKYMTSSAQALDSHMNAFFGSATNNPFQNQAERIALWMALGVVCTEQDRQSKLRQIAANTLTPQQIGQSMVIPLSRSKNLLSSNYDREIQKLIA
jgi:hypothetical protein